MQYNEEFLKKIKSFGALQYDVDRIIKIMQPSNLSQFKNDFSNPESTVFVMYQAGFNAGLYRLDAQQFRAAEIESEIKSLEYKNLKERLVLRKELFGV